jgi:hypothetical protein
MVDSEISILLRKQILKYDLSLAIHHCKEYQSAKNKK